MPEINPAIATLERIKRYAEDALRETKSARTQGDVPRSIQKVINGLAIFISLSGPGQKLPDLEILANRFLAWPIPRSVRSDLCMTMDCEYPRSGTCIMGPTEARQMLEYLFQQPE